MSFTIALVETWLLSSAEVTRYKRVNTNLCSLISISHALSKGT